MPEAVIFDYGVGNLLSLKCALEKVGLNAKITVSAQKLSKADAIALPGVGNFSAAITKLDAVKEQLLAAVESGTPLLGICLGLQLFFQESEEGPGKGLALFEGKAVRLQGEVKVPHMGWNRVQQTIRHRLWDGIADASWFYFVHSYYVHATDRSLLAGRVRYGVEADAALARDNLFAVQFHPEKSHTAGLRLLRNFLDWNGKC